MTLLQKSILSTIVYYDTLDYPLTSFEVFKYLVNPLHISQCVKLSSTHKDFEVDRSAKISLNGVIRSLENKKVRRFIDEENGFYFLKGREEIIRIRIERQKIADQKWKKAKKIIRWLQVIPYLRMVAVCGSLALNNPRQESDIDVVIVVKNGRIWSTRFFVTALLQLMGKRRHKNFTKDRICLNHYLTDKSLEIFKSLSNAQIYAHIIPLLEIKYKIYEEFQKANAWIKNYLLFWPELFVRHLFGGDQKVKGEIKYFKILKKNPLLEFIARLGEICLNNKFGDLLELILEKLQKKLIEKNPLTYKKGGRVTTDDTQLEFHPNSPEGKILDKYNKTMLQLGLKELGREKDSGLL